jgi:hypothetical protein
VTNNSKSIEWCDHCSTTNNTAYLQRTSEL